MLEERYEVVQEINDFGLLNLVVGVIKNTATDIKYGSGVIYEICPVCMTSNKETTELCKNCGTTLHYRKEEAEEFLETQWFEELMSVICKNPTKIKWLIKNRDVTQRRNYE
jgi:predicted amidophosphoribosyltransferase